MPPRLSEQEKEIGRRLRLFRERLMIPATQFARKIGLSRERLQSYESGRSRLRWGAFRAIAAQFEATSAEWLATGEGVCLDCTSSALLAEAFDDEKPFSEAYAEFEAKKAAIPRGAREWEEANATRYTEAIYAMVEALKDLPESHQMRIFQSLDFKQSILRICELIVLRQNALFGEDAPWRYSPTDVFRSIAEKKDLQVSPHAEYSNRMPTKIPDLTSLLSEVREAVSRRGMKAQLARDLDVPFSMLSEWLSPRENTRRPDAENALRLLAWVRNAKPKK